MLLFSREEVIVCSVVDSMVYKYTIPRGPIAAMYSSPGPCYALPDLLGYEHHDCRSSHYRGPAYSFGLRHFQLASNSGPGPRYLPDSKTYRNGRDGSPHYSLSSRHPGHPSFVTPGPGTYSPESSAPTGRQSSPPAYSFGTRHHSRSSDSTPGL